MFERHHEPLLPRKAFVARMARSAALAAGLVLGSLGIGVLGYRGFEDLGWVDALLNASFILTGMGPVQTLHTTGGKLFASVYALFSGIVFLTTVAVLLVPIVHRLMHRFHLEGEKDSPKKETRR